MANIHPSSIVDQRAQLSDEVEVGPGCVIEGEVCIGQGTRLIGNVYLHGPLQIGKNNTIYPFACLGFNPQDKKVDPAMTGAGVVIGDDNHVREGVTIHHATGDQPTTVGNDNYLMCNSHLGHDCIVANHCILANGVLLAGHVELQDDVILGGNAVVHQFCRLGRMSMISGVRGVGKDVPPFCVVYNVRSVGSLNLIGLRRAGYRQHIRPLKRAFELLYLQGHRNSRAVELIEAELSDDPLCVAFAHFLSQCTRGLTPYHRPSDVDNEA